MKRYRSLIVISLLFVVTFVIHQVAPTNWIENLYSQGLFLGIRGLLDFSIGLLPFSSFLIVIPLLIYLIVRWFKRATVLTWKQRISKSLIDSWKFVGLLYVLFYWLWGFNYDRIPMVDHLKIADFQLTDSLLIKRFDDQLNTMQSRGNLVLNEADINFRLIERELRSDAISFLQELDIKISTRVACRQLQPKGILMRFATAGFYSPITGECNIDSGLHYIEKPFVMAHEIFHGLGISGEGECNLLAYIICARSDNDYIRYSGELEYWRYLFREVGRRHPELVTDIADQLPKEVLNDIAAIRLNGRKYPDIMPRLRNAVYDTYLKSNHIQIGLADYNRLVALAIAAKEKGYY